MWKHVALLAWLSRARASSDAITFIDTHAGRGSYALAPTGEWTEGLGLVRELPSPPALIARYLALAIDDRYPGSPAFAASVLDRPHDRLRLFEIDPWAHRALSSLFAADARVAVEASDGLRAAIDDSAHVLIDPPYQDRREWEDVPDAIAAAFRQAPRARFMLWYPIKSYARPNAMHLRLEKAGLSGVALELSTSPLESKKNRLNGSGLVLINAPPGLIEELAALSTVLGRAMALPIPPHAAYWSARTVGFGKR